MPGPDDLRLRDRDLPPPWTVDGRAVAPAIRVPLDEARANLRRFHRIRRRMLWTVRHGLGHLLITLGVQAYRPIRTVSRAWRGLLRSAPGVERTLGVPRSRQLRDHLKLLGTGLTAEDYYKYRLYRPGRMADVPFHVAVWTTVELFKGFLGWTSRSPFSKVELNERLEAAGLPTIPILATCPWRGEPVMHLPDSPHWAGNLFSKGVRGGRGRTQRRWRRQGGGYTDGQMRIASADELLEHLCRTRRSGRTHPGGRPPPDEMVQPCLRNHGAIHEITRGGLSTFRITCVHRSGGRSPEIIVPVFRIAVGDCPVDNFTKGNLGAPIDLATGRVGRTTRIGKAGLREHVPIHPDSGLPVEGLVIPGWHDVLDLVIEAHRLFADVPSLGWDVALTPEGPVLVEANVMWGSAETHHDWPLGLTPYPLWTSEWLEEAWDRMDAAT